MTNNTTQKQAAGPNFQALGLKSPMEVIDILALLKIEGRPVITDDKAHLDPQLKAELVIKTMLENYGIKPNTLPYLAAVIKRNLKNGQLKWSA